MYITQNSKHRTISPIEQKIAELCEARDAAGRDHPCYYEACVIACAHYDAFSIERIQETIDKLKAG